jgi:hypothetical protein
MITLTGTLRQSSVIEKEGSKKTRLTVEHTSPRNDGSEDLKMDQFWFDGDITNMLPKTGSNIAISVRPYAMEKAVKFAAIAVVPQPAQVPKAA